MSIPKGLIIYKAVRHSDDFPIDIKYGYYSDKISSSLHATTEKKPYANFHRRYQKKLVQEISFNFFDDIAKEIEAKRVFSRFSGIRKCTIDSALFSLNRQSKKLMTKILQKLFKSLKRIKQLKLNSLGPLDKSPKTFKNLLLLNQLESLTLLGFKYYADPENLQLFLRATQEALERRSWKDFKALKILPFWPGEPFSSSVDRIDQSLQNLFEFIKGLKSCESIYKNSIFQIILPDCSGLNSKQAEILNKISRISPSLTRIKVHKLEHFSKFFKMCQNAKDLKEVSFQITNHQHKQDIDLSPLKSVPTLQEFKLKMENQQGGLSRDILPQIQLMTNLTVLSLEFCGKPGITNELKRDLGKALAELSELKSLTLKFTNIGGRDYASYKEFRQIWLGDVFEEIGLKKKLEKLSLYFWSLDFENPSHLFEVLCQSLEKLTELTDFDVHLIDGSHIEAKEMILFCEAIRKLSKIQDFCLRVQNSFAFKPNIVEVMFDYIADNFPFLRNLALTLSHVEITQKSFEILYQAVRRMRCLNEVGILLNGQIEEEVDVEPLVDEIKKRASGDIYFYSDP